MDESNQPSEQGTISLPETTDIPVANFAASGTVVDHVDVAISYGIIERFSEGLYSSPNKTFEELVTNSYDAGASSVWVYLAADLSSPDASIVVVDDGESMDVEGLRDLWRIGESKKRTAGVAPPGRPQPVGKFGIGKLATYVLAQELTYLVHRDDHYFAVTMDYGRVSNRSEELLDQVGLRLEVKELTRESALESLQHALSSMPSSKKVFEAIGVNAELHHWTAAVMTSLKPTASNIQQGRLRWVLRTALPLNPNFTLYYNDEFLFSSKASGSVLWNFTIGKDEVELPQGADKPWNSGGTLVRVDDEGQSVPAYRLPKAGVVWGQAKLYKDPLQRGRSEERGRSHGYFVRVRGRLINLDSVDFDIGVELRHGTLTRFHMEVNADDLDDQVASPRESLKDGPELAELKSYLLAVFNKARTSVSDADTGDQMPFLSKDGRISDPPPALSQGPLRRMVKRAVDGDDPAQATLGLSNDDLSKASDLLDKGEDLIENVLVDDLGDRSRLVGFDPNRKAAILNQSHPFVSNYLDGKQSIEAIKLLGLTELLTEAYMLDEEVSSDIVHRVMTRRDQFLRELAHRYPRSAHVIAATLRQSANDEKRLEDAVGDALSLLGFEVIRLGGSSHGTDGIATARLGRRAEPRSDSYAFTYDAKSTGKKAIQAIIHDAQPDSKAPRIRADTARTSVLRVHRERAAEAHSLDVPPDFTLLIAPGFQGENDDSSLINAVCRNDSITAISVENLARVVEMFPLQGLNPLDLRKLFDCRTPSETATWVENQSRETRVPRPPVVKMIEILVKYSEKKNAINVSHLSAYLQAEGHDLDDEEARGLIRGLQALAPKSVYTDGVIVALNATPAALVREIRESLDEYDQDLVGPYLDMMPESKEDE